MGREPQGLGVMWRKQNGYRWWNLVRKEWDIETEGGMVDWGKWGWRGKMGPSRSGWWSEDFRFQKSSICNLLFPCSYLDNDFEYLLEPPVPSRTPAPRTSLHNCSLSCQVVNNITHSFTWLSRPDQNMRKCRGFNLHGSRGSWNNGNIFGLCGYGPWYLQLWGKLPHNYVTGGGGESKLNSIAS